MARRHDSEVRSRRRTVPFSRRTASSPALVTKAVQLSAKAALSAIASIFGDENKVAYARAKLAKITQGTRSFQDFYAEYFRHVSVCNLGNGDAGFAILEPKLSPALATATASWPPMAYKDWVQALIRTDARLRLAAPPAPNTPTRRLPARAADPVAAARSVDNPHGPTTSGDLPAECAGHEDRAGCPSHLRGSLEEFNSAARTAKIAGLREAGRCFICRGIWAATQVSPVAASVAASNRARSSASGSSASSAATPNPSLQPNNFEPIISKNIATGWNIFCLLAGFSGIS